MTPRLGLLAAALVALAGCQPQRSARPSAGPVSAAASAACRQRADEVYLKQNRAELYRADTFATDNRDSPFANFGLPGVTTRGLSGRYQRDNLVGDCLNSAGATPSNPPHTQQQTEPTQ